MISSSVGRNALAARLVEEGILERRPYRQRPIRYEYFLTEKGLELWPVMVAMMDWDDRHLADTGPPVAIRHKDCGGGVDGRGRCGERLDARDAYAEPVPGTTELAVAATPAAAATVSDE